jgi:CRP-like cAMP-binding protein
MSDVVLSGDLGFIGLGDIIQLIGTNGSSGVLRLISKYAPEPGLVYFTKGNIVHARAGSESGLKAAFALFGWIEGEFEFVEEDVSVEKTISKNRMEIILDGLRMVDDGQVEKLGPVTFETPPDGAGEGGSANAEHALNYPVIRGPLIDYMYIVGEDEFSAGQTIIEENRFGTWNWTVLEGLVDVVKSTRTGPIKLYRMGDGAFLGSLDSLSFKSSARNFTVTAATAVQLGVLDTQRLTTEYAALSGDLKSLIKSLEKRLREVTDKAVAVHLKKNNVKRQLKDAKIVIRQGGNGAGDAFVITEGEAFIVQQTDIGPLLLARLGSGDFIGKIPFLDIGHEPLAASVLATKNFKAARADLDRLKAEHDQISPIFKGMLENVATSIMVTSRVAHDFQKHNRKNP